MATDFNESASLGARGEVQYDERGRPYLLLGDGRRYYLQPEDTSDRPQGGFLRGAGHWNPKTAEWEQGGVQGGNLLSLGVGGLLTGGALSALGAFGGAGGAGNAAAGSGAGAAGIGATVPGVGAVSGTGVGAAAGGGGLGGRLLNAALPLGMMGAGRVLGGGGGSQIPPELQEMLSLQKQRAQFQNPLFEALSRLAMSRLPMAQQQMLPGGTGTDPLAALERLGQGGGR